MINTNKERKEEEKELEEEVKEVRKEDRLRLQKNQKQKYLAITKKQNEGGYLRKLIHKVGRGKGQIKNECLSQPQKQTEGSLEEKKKR